MSDNNSDRIYIQAAEVLHHLERVEEICRTIRRCADDRDAVEDLATINMHRATIALTRAIGSLMQSFTEPEPEPSENFVRPMGVAA